MLRLDLARAPRWLDLGHGVRVKVRPISTAIFSAATTAPAMFDLPDDTHQDMRFVALCAEVAKVAIMEWEGVSGEDGAPVEPSPEGIGALMDLYPIAKAFAAAYVVPGLMVSAEKNG
jgi:hypothetical protein